jgi:hypothetical protein
MKRSVQIRIEGYLLDLFDDEKISVSSSVQNISDIAFVFTDFSQSFTVPASPNNNWIFEHFYESDVDGVIDYQIRRQSVIEVDLTHFRSGKIQLEKANVKNGKPHSYSLTFYGDVISLKDAIGEAKLSDLDFTPYAHTYNGTQVLTRIQSDNYSVTYPLVSSSRLWDYNGATATNNIDTTGGAISFTELFPAIKNTAILERIENAYGLTFTGNFITSPRFERSFLYCKNAQTFKFTTPAQGIDITSTASQNSFTGAINTTTNEVTVEYQPTTPANNIINYASHAVTIGITNVTVPSAIYYIDIYANGNLSNTLSGSGNNTYLAVQLTNLPSLNTVYTFKIRTNQAMSLKPVVFYNIGALTSVGSVYFGQTGFCATMTFTAQMNVNQYLPDMKIYDYLSGLLKKFNLTIEPQNNTTFRLLPLEDWYGAGSIHDITTYTDIESIDVERVKLYKKIEFLHEESESFMNKEYKELFSINYGDLSYVYPYDGADYQIKVPFENILFQQFTGSNLQVAYALNQDFQPYITKPIIFYQYEQKTCSQWYFYNGSSNVAVTSYYPLGQDLYYNNLNYSLNFGNDVSSLLLFPITNGLFNTYYFNYLNNLYDRKNRLTYVRTVLPISILTALKLNDKLIIRDKRYIINEMKSDLTSGLVEFTLLNDLRDVCSNNLYRAENAGGTVDVSITLPNGVASAFVDDTSTGCTVSPDTFTADGVCTVTVPANASPIYLRLTEDGVARIQEEGERHRNEEGDDLTYLIPVTYTYTNGETYTCYIIISQYD